jgi:GNAT superfamily N-acetyltransferase
MSEFEIRRIAAEDTYELRRALLRPHQSEAEMAWPGDDDPESLHTGGFRHERLVGIATIHRQRMPGSVEPMAWRIRGLAVDHGQRGLGLGGMLLHRVLDHALAEGGRVVWCNAHVGAFGFFEHHGFRRRGDPFELPEAGPQYVMYTTLG